MVYSFSARQAVHVTYDRRDLELRGRPSRRGRSRTNRMPICPSTRRDSMTVRANSGGRTADIDEASMRLRKAEVTWTLAGGRRASEIDPDVGFRNVYFTTNSGMEVWCDEDGAPVMWSEPRPPRSKGSNRKG